MNPKHVPPGFEGQPLYRNKALFEIMHPHLFEKLKQTKKNMPKNDSYATIKTLCAEKLNIYLPSIGYCHIVLEDENPDSLFELAYKNEFNAKKKPEYPVS
jgi:hypothetical protein